MDSVRIFMAMLLILLDRPTYVQFLREFEKNREQGSKGTRDRGAGIEGLAVVERLAGAGHGPVGIPSIRIVRPRLGILCGTDWR